MNNIKKALKLVEQAYQAGEIPYGEYKELTEHIKKIAYRCNVTVKIEITSDIKKVGPPFVRLVTYCPSKKELIYDPYELPRKNDSRKMTMTLKGTIDVQPGSIIEQRGIKNIRGQDAGYSGKESMYFVTTAGDMEYLGKSSDYNIIKAVTEYLSKGVKLENCDEVPQILKR